MENDAVNATNVPELPGGQPSFEEALAQLEAIVRQLEDGQIPLAESLARYEHGVKLLKRCYGLLEDAERRIELLNHVDPDGRAHSEPFSDEALSLDEKAQARARRRSRAAENEPCSNEDVDSSRRLF
jgi:exodeoxyribonuclease VII small subunit